MGDQLLPDFGSVCPEELCTCSDRTSRTRTARAKGVDWRERLWESPFNPITASKYCTIPWHTQNWKAVTSSVVQKYELQVDGVGSSKDDSDRSCETYAVLLDIFWDLEAHLQCDVPQCDSSALHRGKQPVPEALVHGHTVQRPTRRVRSHQGLRNHPNV